LPDPCGFAFELDLHRRLPAHELKKLLHGYSWTATHIVRLAEETSTESKAVGSHDVLHVAQVAYRVEVSETNDWLAPTIRHPGELLHEGRQQEILAVAGPRVIEGADVNDTQPL
jgi:hypothetical protein